MPRSTGRCATLPTCWRSRRCMRTTTVCRGCPEGPGWRSATSVAARAATAGVVSPTAPIGGCVGVRKADGGTDTCGCRMWLLTERLFSSDGSGRSIGGSGWRRRPLPGSTPGNCSGDWDRGAVHGQQRQPYGQRHIVLSVRPPPEVVRKAAAVEQASHYQRSELGGCDSSRRRERSWSTRAVGRGMCSLSLLMRPRAAARRQHRQVAAHTSALSPASGRPRAQSPTLAGGLQLAVSLGLPVWSRPSRP